MRKLVTSSMAVALLMFSAAGFAQGKIAVLNIQLAVQNTDVAQQRIKELRENAEYAELRAQLDSVESELKKMSEDAEKNSMTWNKSQQQEFAKKRDYKMADRKLILEKLQSENRALSQKIMQELGGKAQKALQQLIEEEGIGLVLRAQNNVIHMDSSYDITAKLTDRINKMN